jgi:tetratricopeptide (TPR) repeat protein
MPIDRVWGRVIFLRDRNASTLMHKRIIRPTQLQRYLQLCTALSMVISQNIFLTALAQSTSPNSCSTLLQSNRIRVEMEPATPIPEAIATDEVRLKLAGLTRLVQVPVPQEYGFDGQLSAWLFGTEIKSGVLGKSQLAELLPKIQPQHRPEAIATLKQVQLRLRSMGVEQNAFRKHAYRVLVDAYHQLQDKDSALAVLSEATDIAIVEPNLERKIGLLLEIADAYRNINQPVLASKTFRQAAQLAQKIPQGGKTFWNFNTLLVQGYIDDGQVEAGLALLPRVADWEAKNQLRLQAVRQYLQQQQLPLARQTAQQINDSGRYKASALVDVAIAYHRQQQASVAVPLFTQSLKIARAPGAANTLWYTVLVPYAKGGQVDAVAQIVPTIPLNQQFNFLLMVAGEYRKQGKSVQSAATIQQMGNTLRKVKISGYEVLDWSIQAMQNGYQPEAIALIRSLNTLPPIPVGGSGGDWIATWAGMAMELGDLDLALTLTKRITEADRDLRGRMMQQIALRATKAGQWQKAWQIAMQIPPPRLPYSSPVAVETFAKVGTALYHLGQRTETETFLTEAMERAQALNQPRFKALAIAQIARERRLIGQVEVSDKLLQLAINTAKGIAPNSANGITSGNVLQEMSNAFLGENQIDPAWQALQSIPPDQRKDMNWEGVIFASTTLGRLEIANAALQQVISPLTYLQRMGPVARANLRQQQPQNAIAILDRMAAQIDPVQMQSMHDSLQELVVLYGQAGALEKGQAVVPKILDSLGRADAAKHLACYQH